MTTTFRRDLLATVALLRVQLDTLEAQARTLPDEGEAPAEPAPIPPPDPVPVVTLPLVGTGAPAGTLRETTLTLVPGDLPEGTTLAAALAGRALALQADVSTRWPDGSACHVLLTVADPGLAAGERATVQLSRVPAAPRGALDQRPFAGRSVTVAVGPWTQAVPLVPGPDRWRDGALAVCWRVDLPVPAEACGASTLHVALDLTLFSDGSLRVVANHRNDVALRTPASLVPGGKVSGTARTDVASAARYATRLLLGGVEIARVEAPAHPLGAWLPLEARVRPDGKPAPVPAWAFPDLAYAHRAGVLSPYAPGGFVAADRDAYVKAMSEPAWAVPFSRRGILANMGQTGGRDDIGVVPKPSAIALMGQDPAMAQYVLGRSVALMGASWHWWLPEEGVFLNQLDRPNLWIDPRDRSWVPGSSEGAVYSLDIAHQPNDHLVPYLLTGDRHRLDAIQAQAAWNLMAVIADNGGRGRSPNVARTPEGRGVRLEQLRSGTGEGWLYERGNQGRGKSWTRRQVVQVAMLVPDAMQPAPGYWRDVLAANVRWYLAQAPAWDAALGEVRGMLALAEGARTATYAPWQADFGVPASVQAVLLGVPGAEAWLRWQLNWLVGRFEHGPAFEPADGAQYSLMIARPADAAGKPLSGFDARDVGDWDRALGAQVPRVTTWAQLGTMARAWQDNPSYGPDFSARTPDIAGDYGLQAMIALTWLLHPRAPWVTERERIRGRLTWLATAAPTRIFAQPRAVVKVPQKNLAWPI